MAAKLTMNAANRKKFERIRRDVLARYAGTADALKNVQPTITRIRAQIRALGIKADIVIGGSVAKQTHLQQEYDCDLFIRYDKKKYIKEDISALTQKILKPFKPERVHGSRDYFRIMGNTEVVPVLKITKASDSVNVTDASPLHVTWAQQHLRKKPKLREEIILTKVFCKAHSVYGAESYIRGFSGHAVDILTIHYGSFIALAQAAAQWKEKTLIDPAKHGVRIHELNASKTYGPLIVIDPIQAERNATAALGEEALARFKKACAQFLRTPTITQFTPAAFDAEAIKRRKNTILIEAEPLEGKDDVVGAKLVRIHELITQGLADFGVKKSGWHWERGSRAYLWYTLKTQTLAPTFDHKGPPLTLKTHVSQFKKKYRTTFTKNKHVWARVRRDTTLALEALRRILSREDILMRAKSIALVE